LIVIKGLQYPRKETANNNSMYLLYHWQLPCLLPDKLPWDILSFEDISSDDFSSTDVKMT